MEEKGGSPAANQVLGKKLVEKVEKVSHVNWGELAECGKSVEI